MLMEDLMIFLWQQLLRISGGSVLDTSWSISKLIARMATQPVSNPTKHTLVQAKSGQFFEENAVENGVKSLA